VLNLIIGHPNLKTNTKIGSAMLLVGQRENFECADILVFCNNNEINENSTSRHLI